jgi:hypothetical protein
MIAATKPDLYDTPTSSPSGELHFKIFAWLWAVASLFHMAHSSLFDKQLNYALLTLSALWVIYRPSLQSFIVLILLQLFDAFYRMPMITNHWIFTAFVNLTILQVFILEIIEQKSFHISGGLLLKQFTPVVRIEVIILYFFAVFHKLNAGFFAPDSSCATDLLIAQNIDSIVPLSPRLIAFNAYFTLIIELMIPVLLCFRSTRNLGMLIGFFFHCVLSYSSYNAFYDFSSMIFAVYILFAASDIDNHITETFSRIKKIRIFNAFQGNTYSLHKLVLRSLLILISLVVIYILNKKLDTIREFHLYFFWTLYSLFVIFCFVRYMIKRKREESHRDLPTFRIMRWSYYLIPIIVFMNGLSPYIGLKTENSYSMFSNLRTEGGVSNHFIIPATFQIFDYQKNVVEIISSTDKNLQEMAKEDKLLVQFEFNNYIKEHKPRYVEYLLNGQKKIFNVSEKSSYKAVHENPYLLYKLMKFRNFNKHDPQPCAH